MELDQLAPLARVVLYGFSIVVSLMLIVNFQTREWKWVGMSFVAMTVTQLAGALVKALGHPELVIPLSTYGLTPTLAFFVLRLTISLAKWKLHPTKGE